MCSIDSVELHELHFPILVRGRRIMPDTEGAGRTIGAPSGYCEYGPLGADRLGVAYVSDGAINNAKGTRGGREGAANRNYLRTLNGELKEHRGACFLILQPGETVVSYTAGGGGYGSPNERSLARVQHDVEEGWVTKERAYEVYGVVFDEEGNIDQAATIERRKVLAKGST
jgi:N-methylhydantoinase B